MDAHRDRFGIDLKTEGIKWKSSSSKSVSLREKLEQAKAIKELYEIYLYLEEFKVYTAFDKNRLTPPETEKITISFVYKSLTLVRQW